MSHYCEICDYTATSSSGLSHHKKTQKHLKLAYMKDIHVTKKLAQVSSSLADDSCKLAVEANKNFNLDILQCSTCKMDFKHKSSLSRHKKSCKVTEDNNAKNNFELEKKFLEKEFKLKLELAEKETAMFKKLEQEKSELLKEKSEMLSNFMNNANTLLNKAHDNTKITAQAMQNVSMSALKYANERFKNAPALLPLENFNINDLDFEKEEDKKQLVEVLIYNAKQKSLDKLLGDHIVSNYKKENPAEQTFHATDCSRLNYIVRELIENALTWSIDKNGIKICSSIIKPLIKKCVTPLLEYQKTLLQLMNNGDYSKQSEVEIIINVIMSIDSGTLENEINKYIAPYFNLDKNKLKDC
jgi:hypothetical protein